MWLRRTSWPWPAGFGGRRLAGACAWRRWIWRCWEAGVSQVGSGLAVGGRSGAPGWRGGWRGSDACAEPFGCCPCRCGLGGALLRLAEFGDRGDERRELGDERHLGDGLVVAAGVSGGSQRPGGGAQAVTYGCRLGEAPVGGAGGAVVGVGGPAQRGAAERGGGGVQGVGGGPGGIGGGIGVGDCEVGELRRGVGGGAGGVIPERLAFGIGEAGCGPLTCGGWLPAASQLGQGEIGGEFAAAVPDRATGLWWCGRGARPRIR